MMTLIIQGLIFLTSSKSSWFTFSHFLMMTTTFRLGATTTKKIHLYTILLPLCFAMIAYMRQLEISYIKSYLIKISYIFYLSLPLCQHKKQIMNREEKKCYHLLQCIKIKWCQKTLKQSFNINQAKTNTITHQSNTINHQTFQIKLIKLTIN